MSRPRNVGRLGRLTTTVADSVKTEVTKLRAAYTVKAGDKEITYETDDMICTTETVKP